MSTSRHDWRVVIAVLLIAAGFGIAVSQLDVAALRKVLGAVCAAVGVALLL